MRSKFIDILFVTFAVCSIQMSAAQTASPTATQFERLTADTPKTTAAGNSFTAPAGWRIEILRSITILEAPEGGSRIALVDVKAKDADAAVAMAWAAYKNDMKWPLKVATDLTDRDGWTKRRNYDYQTSPNEKRIVQAGTWFANDTWIVVIYDMDTAVADKRASQTWLIDGSLLPKGQKKESFAGKTANTLDEARIAEHGKFIKTAQEQLGVPGVSLGLLQGGKVVFSGGFGVRELGKKMPVDGDTKYMIASNTKALTNLMLGKLVDEKKLTWETTATSVLPSFKLGDSDTTKQVLVKHLVCACTGLPRQDFEFLFQYEGVMPKEIMERLGTMQPTSKFGELFQYSNTLAAAAGFIGGHVAFPNLELGNAYDKAMRDLVFEPLGMTSATFDFKKGQTGNFALPHAPDIDSKMSRAMDAINYAVISDRPAGGIWSNVNDVLKYVQMELAEGKLPDGKQYIEKETLVARRASQIALNKYVTYGMGLMIDKTYGVTVVRHDGGMIGFHSAMMWLPEYGVGAVVLTNGDPGWLIQRVFRRKLLEVLFNGHPEADASIKVLGKTFFDERAAERKLLTVPADATESTKLAAHYTNAALGDIHVSRAGATTIFDFGEWKSRVGSRKNPDGTVSFIPLAPGIIGWFEFVVVNGAKRTLIIKDDGQHEYVFEEK